MPEQSSWFVRWTHNPLEVDQKGVAGEKEGARETERRRVCHAQHEVFSSSIVN